MVKRVIRVNEVKRNKLKTKSKIKSKTKSKIKPKAIVGLPLSMWLFSIVTIFISALLLALYLTYDKLPDGIMLTGNSSINIAEYADLIEQISEPTGSSNSMYQYHIIPKKGLEQILLQVLKERRPDVYVRALFMEKQLRLQLVRLLWFVLGLILSHRLIRVMLKTNYSRLRIVINSIFTFLIFYYINYHITIPSVIIPSKLIDIKGWVDNISSYIEYDNRLNDFYRVAFLQTNMDNSFLYILLIIGLLIYGIIYYVVARDCKHLYATNKLDI